MIDAKPIVCPDNLSRPETMYGATMETSFRKSRAEARGIARRWFDGYLARRYGHGPEANRQIATDFDSTERTVRLWRDGTTLPAGELLVAAMLFDVIHRGLDRVDPPGGR